MNNRIKSAFDEVRAEESLKQNTKEYIERKTNSYGKRRSFASRKLMTAIACMAAVLVALGGFQFYFTPVSAISVDVNPSLELRINRFDKVVAVEGYSDEGKAIEEALNLKYMDYESALDALMNSDIMKRYIENGSPVSITVFGNNDAKSEEMLNCISTCDYAGGANIECHSGNRAEADAAHEAGISYGKYKLYLELNAINPEITIEDVRNMTMRQIRDMLEQTSGSSPSHNENGDGGHQNREQNGMGH